MTTEYYPDAFYGVMYSKAQPDFSPERLRNKHVTDNLPIKQKLEIRRHVLASITAVNHDINAFHKPIIVGKISEEHNSNDGSKLLKFHVRSDTPSGRTVKRMIDKKQVRGLSAETAHDFTPGDRAAGNERVTLGNVSLCYKGARDRTWVLTEDEMKKICNENCSNGGTASTPANQWNAFTSSKVYASTFAMQRQVEEEHRQQHEEGKCDCPDIIHASSLGDASFVEAVESYAQREELKASTTSNGTDSNPSHTLEEEKKKKSNMTDATFNQATATLDGLGNSLIQQGLARSQAQAQAQAQALAESQAHAAPVAPVQNAPASASAPSVPSSVPPTGGQQPPAPASGAVGMDTSSSVPSTGLTGDLATMMNNGMVDGGGSVPTVDDTTALKGMFGSNLQDHVKEKLSEMIDNGLNMVDKLKKELAAKDENEQLLKACLTEQQAMTGSPFNDATMATLQRMEGQGLKDFLATLNKKKNAAAAAATSGHTTMLSPPLPSHFQRTATNSHLKAKEASLISKFQALHEKNTLASKPVPMNISNNTNNVAMNASAFAQRQQPVAVQPIQLRNVERSSASSSDRLVPLATVREMSERINASQTAVMFQPMQSQQQPQGGMIMYNGQSMPMSSSSSSFMQPQPQQQYPMQVPDLWDMHNKMVNQQQERLYASFCHHAKENGVFVDVGDWCKKLGIPGVDENGVTCWDRRTVEFVNEAQDMPVYHTWKQHDRLPGLYVPSELSHMKIDSERAMLGLED